jgi:hypothetical protein
MSVTVVIRVSPSDLGTTRSLGHGLSLGVEEGNVPCVYWAETVNRGDQVFVALWPTPHSAIRLERQYDRSAFPVCVVCLAGATDEEVAAARAPEVLFAEEG